MSDTRRQVFRPFILRKNSCFGIENSEKYFYNVAERYIENPLTLFQNLRSSERQMILKRFGRKLKQTVQTIVFDNEEFFHKKPVRSVFEARLICSIPCHVILSPHIEKVLTHCKLIYSNYHCVPCMGSYRLRGCTSPPNLTFAACTLAKQDNQKVRTILGSRLKPS